MAFRAKTYTVKNDKRFPNVERGLEDRRMNWEWSPSKGKSISFDWEKFLSTVASPRQLRKSIRVWKPNDRVFSIKH